MATVLRLLCGLAPMRGWRSLGRRTLVWLLTAIFCAGAFAGPVAQTMTAAHGMDSAMSMAADCAEEMGDASGPSGAESTKPDGQAKHAAHACCVVSGCGSSCASNPALQPASFAVRAPPVVRRAAGFAASPCYASPALAPLLEPPIA